MEKKRRDDEANGWCRSKTSRPTLMIPETRMTTPCRGMSWTGRNCFSIREGLRVIEKSFLPSCPKGMLRTGSSRGISHPGAHLNVSTAIQLLLTNELTRIIIHRMLLKLTYESQTSFTVRHSQKQ